MGFQGHIFIEENSQVVGSGGKWNYVLASGDGWSCRKFTKPRSYEQESCLTLIHSKVVDGHPPPNVDNTGLQLGHCNINASQPRVVTSNVEPDA